jgi:endonuclease/exonuclease/phosphatase family metal-dependent hydrolase
VAEHRLPTRWRKVLSGSAVTVVLLGCAALLVHVSTGTHGAQPTSASSAPVAPTSVATTSAPAVTPVTGVSPTRSPTKTAKPGTHGMQHAVSKHNAKLRELVQKAAKTARAKVLGSQHTRGKSGYAPGVVRMAAATSLLASRHVSIVGFSELQRDQLGVFQSRAGNFGVYPGTAAGSEGVPQSLAWNSDVWTEEDAFTFTIPFSHQIRPQPAVKLKNNVSGAEIWAVNVHNSPQGEQEERNRATSIELGVLRSLIATGLPVVMTGDFNEKVEAFCTWTGQTTLSSAVGGTSSGGCHPPAHPRVDWIFTTPGVHVESYDVTRDSPVPSITDHAALFSTLSLS